MERITIIEFTIEGKAEPQGRPRAVRMGAGVRMYDPPKSKAYKQVVSLKGRSYMARNHLEPYTEPLKVTLEFYFKPPKSYSKKRLKAIENLEEFFIKKPDIDNLVKCVTDGLNGIAYLDDALIVELVAKKQYADSDYTKVIIEPVR